MRESLALALLVAVAFASTWAVAQDETPKAPPPPQKEHEWLKQLDGEWETEAEMVVAPDKPTVKCKGTETTKNLGGFWSVGVYKGDFEGTDFTGMMTIGYSAQKKKYVGTWVCSMCDWLCEYEGSLKDNELTLECVGPSPIDGKPTKMKDVIVLKNKDHKVLTSYLQLPDGKWVTFMTLHAKRKQ